MSSNQAQVKNSKRQPNDLLTDLFGSFDCSEPCYNNGPGFCNQPERTDGQLKSQSFRRKEPDTFKQENMPVGVGIIFDCGPDGKGPNGDGLIVNSLVPNGAAEQSSVQLSSGDTLVRIDDQDVGGMDAKNISRLILGMEKSIVRLTFAANNIESKQTYEVTIIRRRPTPHWVNATPD